MYLQILRNFAGLFYQSCVQIRHHNLSPSVTRRSTIADADSLFQRANGFTSCTKSNISTRMRMKRKLASAWGCSQSDCSTNELNRRVQPFVPSRIQVPVAYAAASFEPACLTCLSARDVTPSSFKGCTPVTSAAVFFSCPEIFSSFINGKVKTSLML